MAEGEEAAVQGEEEEAVRLDRAHDGGTKEKDTAVWADSNTVAAAGRRSFIYALVSGCTEDVRYYYLRDIPVVVQESPGEDRNRGPMATSDGTFGHRLSLSGARTSRPSSQTRRGKSEMELITQ